jgi:N,N'-diacetyllegionaminate synthase
MSTLIIAEAGVNHNGELAMARRLVELAAQAGADVVKFQTFRADRLASPQAPMADYQRRNLGAADSQLEMLRRLELSPQMHQELHAHAGRCGIEFLSTGFDCDSVDFLMRLGVSRLKIPSGEITNLPYLRHVGRQGKPIVLSTGMATLAEVEAALSVLETAGTAREHITVLHCTTEYPAPMADVNLRAMNTIRETFDVAVGYSDHTSGIEVAVAAVALGATIIEKHFTLDRSLPGPDHAASLEPQELAALVRAVRNIEQALGDGIKRPAPSELGNRAVARQSLVAARAIRAGETFSAANVTVKRPGGGLSPMRWDEVLGRTARRDFAADEPLEL